ncbi:MAG: Uma2 family endonuclease [Vicinamibacterales bacterium]
MRSPAARADTRLTYDDFVLFPDDGKRHEIIDGEHYVTPSPNVRHQRLVGRLLCAIERYLRANPCVGEVFSAPLDVVLSHFDVVEPDLLFVAGDQADILTEKNVQGPPALVIEVLSKGTRKRDAQTKRRLFERSGVREYWLVDPELDAVQVFRPTPEGRLARAAELTAEDGGVVTTPLLPGCQIDLRELFRKHIRAARHRHPGTP